MIKVKFKGINVLDKENFEILSNSLISFVAIPSFRFCIRTPRLTSSIVAESTIELFFVIIGLSLRDRNFLSNIAFGNIIIEFINVGRI